MNVKSIFKTLIIIVMCVLLGAFLLNILLPNVTAGIVNATEDQIFNATGLQFDFNNDGNTGDNNKTYDSTEGDADGVGKNTVNGFK